MYHPLAVKQISVLSMSILILYKIMQNLKNHEFLFLHLQETLQYKPMKFRKLSRGYNVQSETGADNAMFIWYVLCYNDSYSFTWALDI